MRRDWRAAIRGLPLEQVMAEFESSYVQMLALARSLDEAPLFRKGLYPWMRVWPLSRWIAANTSSHYRWARIRIRRWLKMRRQQ